MECFLFSNKINETTVEPVICRIGDVLHTIYGGYVTVATT